MYVTLLAVVNLAAGLILAEAVAADGLPEAVSDEAQAILDKGIERLRAHGIQARSRLAFDDPEQGILRAASEMGAELIGGADRDQPPPPRLSQLALRLAGPATAGGVAMQPAGGPRLPRPSGVGAERRL